MKICPKCKSKDVIPDFSSEAYAKGSFFNQYRCNKCGYTSQFFPEIKK